MNDCIRNKAGILIGLFTLLGCFAVRAQNIAVKTNLLYGGYNQSFAIGFVNGSMDISLADICFMDNIMSVIFDIGD